MNPVRLESRIALDEGFRAEPYQDTVGVWTYGYGATRDMEGNPVHERTPAIVEENARRLLRSDIFNAIVDAWLLIPHFRALNDTRQEVIVNMAYNLGRNGLSKFRRMIAAINAGDYAQASDEIRDSKYYRQVGKRAERLADAMEAGFWPAENRWHV